MPRKKMIDADSAIAKNVNAVRRHYDWLFARLDRGKAYEAAGWGRRPPMVNMGYWTRGATTDREAHEQLVHELACRVSSLRGRRVLDAGCGLAGPAALLACDYGAQIDGINIVEQQLRWARQYIEGNGLGDKIHVYVASAMDMPFVNELFDVVFSLEAAHCFLDKRRFLEEARRVLRPGGTLLLADITATTHLALTRWQPALKLNLVTAADWRRMIEDVGFTIEQTEMIGRAVYPGCLRWSARIAGERRRAMVVNRSPRAGGSVLGRRLKMMQAWILELLLYRTFFATMIRLRLREYVLVVARKPEAPILR